MAAFQHEWCPHSTRHSTPHSCDGCTFQSSLWDDTCGTSPPMGDSATMMSGLPLVRTHLSHGDTCAATVSRWHTRMEGGPFSLWYAVCPTPLEGHGVITRCFLTIRQGKLATAFFQSKQRFCARVLAYHMQGAAWGRILSKEEKYDKHWTFHLSYKMQN